MKLPDLPDTLTPDEVGALFHLKRRTVLELPIPKVRVGKGRGKFIFKKPDVLQYLENNTEYPPEKGANDGGRIQKKQKAVRLQGLPNRDHLQKIRLANQSGGQTGGSGVPH